MMSKSCQLTICEPTTSHADAFIGAVHRSKDLYHPWVLPPSTHEAYQEYLFKIATDRHYGFLIVEKESDKLVGVVNINEICRGVFQSGYLGYYAFKPFQSKGLMQQGMKLVIEHAFIKLKLHRLEANIQPENIASIKLVEKLNFQKEGYSPKYLKINGQWRDHIRFALLNDEL